MTAMCIEEMGQLSPLSLQASGTPGDAKVGQDQYTGAQGRAAVGFPGPDSRPNPTPRKGESLKYCI